MPGRPVPAPKRTGLEESAASPAQLAAYDRLWRMLLAPPDEKTVTEARDGRRTRRH
jgi:hypothetical protein